MTPNFSDPVVITTAIVVILGVMLGWWQFLSSVYQQYRMIVDAEEIAGAKKVKLRSYDSKDLTSADLVDYFSMYSYLEAETMANRLRANLPELKKNVRAVTSIIAWKIVFKKRPGRTIIGFVLLMLFPAVWPILLPYLIFHLYAYTRAGRFEDDCLKISP